MESETAAGGQLDAPIEPAPARPAGREADAGFEPEFDRARLGGVPAAVHRATD